MTPYRTVDIEARRQAAVREAKRVRDALDVTKTRVVVTKEWKS